MDLWDQQFVNAEVRGYFDFGADQLGSFHFGYVQCEIDYRLTQRDGQPAVEFSFEGMDETDPCSGRGHAVLEHKELAGMLYFHRGDESGFVAKRAE